VQGGPGCSSLEGFLQENGPFLWNYGTFRPVANPWGWNLLSNVLWVEQPVGTGYTRGTPRDYTQRDVANNFVAFFRNFVDTFELHGKKLYLTGESYAGYYVPYIAEAMFDANDTRYFDVQGTMIYE
jgi:carboxypeptidase D